jgi:putative Mg2+ transporter-C (MgtC) family protein
MQPLDLGLQLDLVLRLLLAAFLGAAIGFEREVRGHPAGLRTHTLVALGSALFTELSIYGFPSEPGQPVDPTRIAAQIVTGIGFLGGGAILKEGLNVKGLTTAASLWAVAAIGMAAGVGNWFLAIAATAIVLMALWPFGVIYEWIDRRAHLESRARQGE